MSLMDQPADPTQIELGMVLTSEFRDEDSAIAGLTQLQVAIRRFIATEFPNVKFEMCQATYGNLDEETQK